MKILISGAGIAGLTAGWWLCRQGHQVRIIEVAPDLRDQGYMMDFFGPGYDVAEQMGILRQLDEKSYDISRFHSLSSSGRIKSCFDYTKLIGLLDKRYFLLMRGDLVNVLNDELPVDIQFDTAIESLEQDEDGVHVAFNSGGSERFDFIIGADGIHSRVRELVFGPEEHFRKYMGYYVAARIHVGRLGLPAGSNAFYSVTVPDKQVVVCPLRNDRYASFFVWRTQEYPHLTEEERHGVLKGLFENQGWLVPDLVNEVEKDEKLYFDRVAQIRMEEWHSKRVVLIGDAAWCLSLMAGQGASFAMAGAFVLANCLKNAGSGLTEAFRNYQNHLWAFVKEKQKLAERFSRSFVPQGKFSAELADLYMKVMFWPPFLPYTKKLVGADHNDVLSNISQRLDS